MRRRLAQSPAMAFAGFGKGALAFYDDLAANNSREWWLANKKRYEDEVRRPMEELLAGRGRRVRRGEAVPPEPRHPLLQGQDARTRPTSPR